MNRRTKPRRADDGGSAGESLKKKPERLTSPRRKFYKKSITAELRFAWRGKNLLRKDWDFEGCPDWQLPYCLHYEIMREIIEDRERLRRYKQWLRRTHGPQPDPKKQEWVLDPWMDGFLTEFPDTPFLQIPERKRDEWLTEWGWHKREDEGDEPWQNSVGVVSVDNLQEKGVYKNSVTHWTEDRRWAWSYCAFKINWARSDKHLCDAFRKFLKWNRPKRDGKPAEFREWRGQTDNRKALKFIGARRLVIVYGKRLWEALSSDTEVEAILETMPYKTEQTWRRAKQKADKIISGFLPH